MFEERYIYKKMLGFESVKMLMGRSYEEGLMAEERDDAEFPEKAGVFAPRKK